MRIGIDLLSERNSVGGVHTYVNELLTQLAQLRDEDEADLEIVVFAHSDYPFLVDDTTLASFDLRRTRLGSLSAIVRRVAQHALLPRLARRARLDVVHSINNVLPGRIPCPSVVTVHDLSPFVQPERFGRLKHRYLVRAVPASIRRATRTVCVSNATREQVLTWVPDVEPSRLDVVPQAVSARFHNERQRDTEAELRCRHNLPQRFFLHVSLIEPGKNLAAASRALARLKQRGVNAPLVVVGRETPHIHELRKTWRELGIENDVRYLGPMPAESIPHLYRMARAFLFPSFYEGFGLPVLEAFACGTPTITSNRSSLPEVAGKAALLVEPDDDAQLAGAMEKLWRHHELRDVLRRRGLTRAREFSWRDTARRTVDVYRKAIGASDGCGQIVTSNSTVKR